jgi:hypothetical protein
VGVLGFGGLGQAAAKVLAPKREMVWVAAADQKGYAYDTDGLNPDRCIATYRSQGSLGYLEPTGTTSNYSIQELIEKASVDGYFLALPNLPNTFMASVARQFIQAGWQGVLVDALKRTSAVEQLLELQEELQASGITYMTGCGATPGLLTAAATLAAQSYAEIHSVKITFGVGIANWEAYRATIREDIAHLPGYDVECASQMSDAEVEALLDKTNGILTLENMEHADDVQGFARAIASLSVVLWIPAIPKNPSAQMSKLRVVPLRVRFLLTPLPLAMKPAWQQMSVDQLLATSKLGCHYTNAAFMVYSLLLK